ncbi:MAG: MlaE family lipid ABC transporter permease subunit [Deltaproteobacteria bacterium]|nr:MlaE family lipid ABC transporter permease subunit [Deltaproteobacteria bacterium]
MDIESSTSILDELHSMIAQKSPALLAVDLDNVTYFDDFGALVLIELKNAMTTRDSGFKIIGTQGRTKDILALVDFDAFEECLLAERKRSENIIVRLGDETLTQASNLKFLVSFVGSVFLSFLHVFLHPKSLRVNDTIACMEKTGVNALPIVGMTSFLLGLVIAFMSSLLQQFGANIYVASLVAVAMVSELGPIMTAIVVAGRSGSAFAAEIGTMKISEEIDALVAMGFNPTLFIVVPKIIASVIVVPLLTLFADLFGVAGGLVVGVFLLDLTANSYISQTLQALTLFEVCWGMLKSVVFALLIVWIGCLRGFQTRGGADAVGNSATSAVVSSIFLIILFDSIFAVVRSFW